MRAAGDHHDAGDRRAHDAHDARGRHQCARQSLCRDGAAQGRQTVADHRSPRPAECLGADCDRDCAQPRLPHRRRRGGGIRLHLPRHGQADGGCGFRARRAGGAGLRAGIRRDLHPPEPDRRRAWYRHQPQTAASQMTATHEATSGATKAAASISQRRQRSVLGNMWRGFVKAPFSAKFGMVIIASYVVAAIFAPMIAPYGEAEVVGKGYLPWSWQNLMGTDQLGRDLFARLIYGARNTVGVALLTTILSFALGGGLGLLAAIAKGWIDQILSRIVDALMAIPVLIFALLLLSIFGTSVLKLVLVMAVLDSTRVFRLTRAVAQNVVVMDYVECARLRGEG